MNNKKIHTTECKNHAAVKSVDTSFYKQIGENRAACGSIMTTETCRCGGTRQQNSNGNHVSDWTAWSDSDVHWWTLQNLGEIESSCSDEDLAEEWTDLIADAARNQMRLADLESIRSRVRAGKKITLYEKA